MNKESFVECERRQLNRMLAFRLPSVYYRVGLIVAAIAVLSMFGRAMFLEGDYEWLKTISRQTLLIGLLLSSLAKDKEEDEMTNSLRMQSCSFAFVVGVIYALVMPYVDYGVSNVIKPEGEVFKSLGDFQLLIFMLMVQLMFYYTLKRYR